MQFFVGLKEFQNKKIFDPSLFVTIRKRIGKTEFDKLNIALIKSLSNKTDIKNISKKNDSDNTPPNKGHLQADATVADQYITFPTDSKLLNTARKKLDLIIDKLYYFSNKSSNKPRTNRLVLDKEFLAYSKKRRKSKKVHRKMVRKLLESVNRNINFVTKLLPIIDDLNFGKDNPITQKDIELFNVIQELYLQQKQMYDENTNTIKNRIVSVFQPHVRPILRGKEKSRVEFGSKLGVSLDNGFARINTLSWDAYHEGKDLISQVESYFEIHGYYPELVLVDKAYHTRKNRLWLSEKGIRITAEPLGRKPKQKPTQYQRTKRKKEYAERNHIEGKFGQGKNGYNLNKIRAKLIDTSESWVSCIFFVMNLVNHQRKTSLAHILSCIIRLNNQFITFYRIMINWVTIPNILNLKKVTI